MPPGKAALSGILNLQLSPNNMAIPTNRRQHMAKMFPQLYRPTTAAEAEAAARPIAGMRFAVGQRVAYKRTGHVGTVDYCTAHTNGSRQYVITWADGRPRSWVWEIDLVDAEPARPQTVIDMVRRDSEAKCERSAAEQVEQSPTQAGSGPSTRAASTDAGASPASSQSAAAINLAVCTCGHPGAWHRPECPKCSCDAFERAAGSGEGDDTPTLRIAEDATSSGATVPPSANVSLFSQQLRSLLALARSLQPRELTRAQMREGDDA